MTLDPLQVFSAAVAALSDGDWLRAAAYCDTASLADFKADAERRYDPVEDAHEAFAEVYLERNPEMPRAVAEYLASLRQSRPSLAEQLRTEFPGFASYQRLATAPAQEVFAAWLKGRSLRHQIEKAIAGRGLPPEHAEAALAEAGTEYTFDVIGWLPEGSELAHVLFRERSTQDSPDDGVAGSGLPGDGEHQFVPRYAAPLIATCKRQLDGSWRLLASDSFLRPGSGWFGYEIEPVAESDQSEA